MSKEGVAHASSPFHLPRDSVRGDEKPGRHMAVHPGIDAALEADRRHVWHPFTQMSAYRDDEKFIERASGNYLFEAGGRPVFDAASSIWLTLHGHCHPAIADAIASQARLLDHATLLGQSNAPSALLAARLAALLPARLSRVFFACDGASAVEAALKIALQYRHNRGERRTLFVSHERGYHGDTVGAMSVSGVADFLRPFEDLRFPTLQLAWSADYPDRLARVLEQRSGEIAGVIIEPLVQLAGGVRLMPADALARIADACRAHGVLLIVDEIATGFGRTGSMFAFEQAEIEPDIVCLGKSLTGGTLALSATVVSEEIFEAFLGEPRAARQFLHGHSYAGNPIACAAALASLGLFESEHTLERVMAQLPAWYAGLDALREHAGVSEVRRLGYIAGIELRDGLESSPSSPTRAWGVCDELWERGYFVRPIGPTLLLVPPLSATPEELASLLRAIEATLDG